MNHEETTAIIGGIIALVACAMHIRRRLAGHISREQQDDLLFATKLEQLKAARPHMPPPPPLRQVREDGYPAMQDEYFVQHISKGRDTYGQVRESVRINTGQSVPTMPRPTPAARCQWCRVKLTFGACVDGCGGHQ